MSFVWNCILAAWSETSLTKTAPYSGMFKAGQIDMGVMSP